MHSVARNVEQPYDLANALAALFQNPGLDRVLRRQYEVLRYGATPRRSDRARLGARMNAGTSDSADRR
jgi:hypothetical protein